MYNQQTRVIDVQPSGKGLPPHAARERRESLAFWRGDLVATDKAISDAQIKIGQLEFEAKECVRRSRQFDHPERLDRVDEITGKLEGLRRRLPILEGEKARIEEEIKTLSSKPVTDDEEKQLRGQLLALEAKRSAALEKASAALKGVRGLFASYCDLSSQMEELAEMLELDFSSGLRPDGVGDFSFLDAPWLRAHQAWHNAFFPDISNAKEYVVIADELETKPSFNSCGLALKGEVIPLSDAEAAPLLAKGLIKIKAEAAPLLKKGETETKEEGN